MLGGGDGTDSGGAGRRYAAARTAVVELVRSLAPEDLARPVPACPGWRVRDVVAHLVGVAVDNVQDVEADGDLDRWTAGHVGERASSSIDVLLAEWDQSALPLEAKLESEEMRLPAIVLDLLTHEQDVRGAVDRPGRRDEPALLMAAQLLGRGWSTKIDRAGLDPLTIVSEMDGDVATPVFAATPFELFRCAFGRRSDAQLRARFGAVTDPAPYIELLCIFGPSAVDIDE